MVVVMRVLLTFVLALLFLAGPISIRNSLAQMDPWQLKLETERRERIENERTYNETMKHIRSKGPIPKKDPWGGVRKDQPETKR
jgi:hypothetical protein